MFMLYISPSCHFVLCCISPIDISLVIDSVEGPDARKTACYDIDVEVVSLYNDTCTQNKESTGLYMISSLTPELKLTYLIDKCQKD